MAKKLLDKQFLFYQFGNISGKQSIKSRKKKRSTSKQKSRRNGIVKIEITDSPVEEDDTFEIDLNAYEVESGDLHGGYKGFSKVSNTEVY